MPEGGESRGRWAIAGPEKRCRITNNSRGFDRSPATEGGSVPLWSAILKSNVTSASDSLRYTLERMSPEEHIAVRLTELKVGIRNLSGQDYKSTLMADGKWR